MNKTTANLILLNYNQWEYIKYFKGFIINNNIFCASINDINIFTQHYNLHIYNYNTVVFYMNLLNFGEFSNWKVQTTFPLDIPISFDYYTQIFSIESVPKYFNICGLNSIKCVSFYRDL